MKKKVVIGLLAAAMLALAVFSGCGPAPATPENGEVIELHMATFWPGTDFQVTEGHERWIDEIEKRTDGRVKITLYPGEALLGAREIYEGVAAGSADIGTTCPSYTPGTFPLTEAFELPGYRNDNALVASLTMHEGYKKLKETVGIPEYDDVKMLMFWATGPGDVMTKRPVHSLEDLSGMEMRVVGGTIPTMEALGVIPHSMPMSEAYLQLDQGLVEGILAPTDTLKGFRLAEVLNYVTETPFLYNIVFMKVMNLDRWNALPPDIQQVFEEVSEEFVMEYGQLRTDHTRMGLEYGVEEHGMEVINLSSEEEERWREQIEPIVENWIESKEAAGLPGTEVVEIVRDLDAKYSEMHGDY